MSAFKPYPEVSVQDGAVEGLYRIVTNGDRVVVGAHFAHKQDAERFAACWNACRKLAFPEVHITASADHNTRLEQLRKDAWARVQELEAEISQLRASMAVLS